MEATKEQGIELNIRTLKGLCSTKPWYAKIKNQLGRYLSASAVEEQTEAIIDTIVEGVGEAIARSEPAAVLGDPYSHRLVEVSWKEDRPCAVWHLSTFKSFCEPLDITDEVIKAGVNRAHLSVELASEVAHDVVALMADGAVTFTGFVFVNCTNRGRVYLYNKWSK